MSSEEVQYAKLLVIVTSIVGGIIVTAILIFSFCVDTKVVTEPTMVSNGCSAHEEIRTVEKYAWDYTYTRLFIILLIGMATSLLNPYIAAVAAAFAENLFMWATMNHENSTMYETKEGRLAFAAFWPLALLPTLIFITFLGLVNRAFRRVL